MDKRNRETFSLDFDGEIGGMGCALAERVSFRQRFVITVRLLSRCAVVCIVVVGSYKEKLQRYWLNVSTSAQK
jgi:hypothetical protein